MHVHYGIPTYAKSTNHNPYTRDKIRNSSAVLQLL